MENINIKCLSPIDGDLTIRYPLAGDESKISSQEKVQDPKMQTSRSMDRSPDQCHLIETYERNSSINNDRSIELTTSVQYSYTDSRAPKPDKANKKRCPRKRNATKLIPRKNQRQEELPAADQQGKPNNYIVFPIEHPTTTGHNFPKDENEMKAPDVKAGLLKKKTTKNAQEHALRQRQRRCRAGKAFSKLREMLPGIEPRANQSKVIDYLAAYLRYFNTIVHSSDIETYHTYFANDLIAGKIDPLAILGISHETFLRNLLPQSNLMESTTPTKENVETICNQEKNYETKEFLMNQFAAHFSKLHENMDVSENDA